MNNKSFPSSLMILLKYYKFLQIILSIAHSLHLMKLTKDLPPTLRDIHTVFTAPTQVAGKRRRDPNGCSFFDMGILPTNNKEQN